MSRKASATKARIVRTSVPLKRVKRKRKPRQWTVLTPSERIARCRTSAIEAKKLECAARPEMKPLYRALYTQWMTLADETERQLKKLT
jgi:hypothetical protein